MYYTHFMIMIYNCCQDIHRDLWGSHIAGSRYRRPATPLALVRHRRRHHRRQVDHHAVRPDVAVGRHQR
ncbi:unnamed protein product [Spirodela intermedia]|uniref:Uncharacterized protein n=1 Tax=Spirodela intermedia TaxID=51605 RepID=A0A7I8J4L4_SPIIN|nr:unnamed protein product [Spirodela intermedia]CAA6665011.1 unnamed protein product [Spirodela intermedia]